MTDPRLQLDDLDPQRFERLQRILDQVLDLPGDEARRVVVQLCGGDRVLEAAAEALLGADRDLVRREESPDAFLSSRFLAARTIARLSLERGALGAQPAGPPEEDLTGRRAGPYRLEREIGRGGMGRVYLARRADGQFDQTVAIKVLKRGVDTDEVLRRFLQERQILARLEHPNIARLLDGGATDDGRPFLAMELVEGVPITRWCEEQATPLDARLEIFRSICAAVQYAHRHLVIHRDLKPANVMVTANGQPKLLDFGIARLLTEDEGSSMEPLTRLEALPMTPAYAAPEQLRGEAATTQTDVYGLGVILYELLTGRRPFEIKASTLEEARSEVANRAPPAPSNVAPERLRPALRGDLDAIALTALATDPPRRYDSVEALAEDLLRYRDHLPVRARRPGRLYRLRKLARRHAGALAAGGLVLALVVAYSTTTAIMLERQRIERARAEVEARRAERIQKFLGDMLAAAGPSRLGSGTEQIGSGRPNPTVREALDVAAGKAERELRDDPPVLAGVEHVIAETYFALGVYDRAETHARLALSIRERLGAEQPVSESLNLLSQILQRAMNYDDALHYAHRSTLLNREEYGETSIQYALSLQNEQAILASMGRYEDAAKLMAESARIGRAGLPAEDPRLIEILSSEAMSRGRVEGMRAAEPGFREVVAITRRVYGDDHPRTAVALTNLAVALGDLHRYAEAESLHRAVLDLRRRVLGSDNVEVAVTLTSLGFALREQGKLDEAETVLREAVEMRTRLLGPDDRGTQVSQTVLANLLLKRGAVREAETLHRSVLDSRRRTLGPDHPLVAGSLLGLADALAALGRRIEAVALAREAVALRERVLPAGHPDIAKAKERLAAIQRAGVVR